MMFFLMSIYMLDNLKNLKKVNNNDETIYQEIKQLKPIRDEKAEM